MRTLTGTTFNLPRQQFGSSAPDGNGAIPLTQDLDFREDMPPVVDLNSAASFGDANRDNFVSFTEGDAAVAIALAGSGVTDSGENDIVELAVIVGLPAANNGASELITVNGVTFPLNQSLAAANTSTTVGGVPVTISYDGTTIRVVPTDGVTSLDDAALASLVARNASTTIRLKISQ